MEDGVEKLSAKLEELEQQAKLDRLAREKMEKHLQDNIYPLASAGFAFAMGEKPYTRFFSHGESDVSFYLTPEEKRVSSGRSHALWIKLLEEQVSYLKTDLQDITTLQTDRDKLLGMKALWEMERTSLLQDRASLLREQRKRESLGAETIEQSVGGETKPDVPATAADLTATETGCQTAPPLVFENPELNLVSWVAFRMCLLKEPADSFAIDVLNGEPDVSFERPTHYTMWSRKPRHPLKSVEAIRPHAGKKLEAAPSRGEKPIPERIRINSRHILGILSKIHGEALTADDKPIVMTRPYKALDYWSEAIRGKFVELESEFGPPEARSVDAAQEAANPNDGGQADAHAGDATQQSGKAEEAVDEWTHSLTAYQHLKCLVRFMDEVLRDKVAFLESDRCRTVAFADIWYLFRPGDEVIDQSLRQVYRIISISSAGHQVFPPWHAKWEKEDKVKEAKAKEETPVFLNCVYIDFDGKQLGPVVKKIRIPRYDNEKAVTSFEVFPLRFANKRMSAQTPHKGDEPWRVLREKMIERGKQFLNITEPKHMRYNGLTLDTRDEIDSNVVVDFQEAFSHFQGVQKANRDRDRDAPNDLVPQLSSLIGRSMEEDFGDGRCSAQCCGLGGEVVFKDAFAEKKRNQDYMQSLVPEDRREPPPAIYPRPLKDFKGKENDLIDGDYLIMSYRVLGFVLRSRKWGESCFALILKMD